MTESEEPVAAEEQSCKLVSWFVNIQRARGLHQTDAVKTESYTALHDPSMRISSNDTRGRRTDCTLAERHKRIGASLNN